MISVDVSPVILVALACSFPVLLTVAAVGDITRFIIPNTLSIALVALAVPALLLGGDDVVDVLWHLAAGLVVFALASLLFFRGLLGGGDVKLLAAAACWTGWPLVIAFLAYMALAGGLLAIILIVARRLLHNRITGPNWLAKLFDRSSGLPYGVAIAIGGCLIWDRLPIFSTAFPG